MGGGPDVTDGPAPPLELPFVFGFELAFTLNTGFGIETFCVFPALSIDWRLRIVDPVDLFFVVDRSKADLPSFFGSTSDARSL